MGEAKEAKEAKGRRRGGEGGMEEGCSTIQAKGHIFQTTLHGQGLVWGHQGSLEPSSIHR